jgi:acyl-homoserine lactone acylase PvdQ
MNPDAQDLFLEEVVYGKYLASDGSWKEVGTIHEVIKVRLGAEVHFDIRYTDNGVLLEKNILHKQVRAFSQHLNQQVWESDDELWNSNFQYAYAMSMDPLTHHNLGPGNPFKNYI